MVTAGFADASARPAAVASLLATAKGDQGAAQWVLAAEHAGRFSKVLLDRLHELSAAGCIGWSEMATPTLCRWL